MPYTSKRQARWANATGQTFAKRWNKLTTFTGLPEHKDASLHGPGGLLATPGMGSKRRRKWGQRLKDKQIKGNLYRSDTGKFTAGNGPPSEPKRNDFKKPLGGAKKPRAAAKPKQTPEQRTQARMQAQAQQRAINLTKVADDTGLGDNLANLDQFSAGKPIRPEDEAALIAQGVMERGTDGAARVTEQGRVLLNAAKRGDSQRARDALSRGRDQVRASASRATERTARETTAATKRQEAQARHEAVVARRAATAAAKKPAKASSGAKKPAQATPKAPAAKPAHAPPRRSAAPSSGGSSSGGGSAAPKPKPPAAAPAAPAVAKPTISPALRDAASAVSEGADVTPAQVQQLVTNGLVKLNKDGEPILTAAGLRATMKAFTLKQTAQDRAMFANMGSSGGGGGGGGSGGKPSGGQGGLWSKGADGKRSPQAGGAAGGGGGAKPKDDKPAEKKPLPPKARNNRNDQRRTKLMNEANRYDAIRAAAPKSSDDYKRATAKLREIGAQLNKMDDELFGNMKEASFTVFKDHTGAPRWLARTTTAYRDRDGEIISEAALDADSQRMMATKAFGPLRYWHVGQPDPFDESAPWGQGLDIGQCDYSVVIGRTRVESGTFSSPMIAEKVARVADRFEMSPGFFHPLDQPDESGVFNSIRTFERSLVPTNRTRASNLFTGFTVKELHMEIDLIEQRFKAAIADLGLNAEQATELGQNLIATEKAAAQQGITFKETELPDLEINGVTYKAFPPKAVTGADGPPMDAEVKADAPMVDETVVDEPMPGEDPMGDYLGDMSWDEFAAKLTDLLAPVLKVQDLHKGMTDALGEMKAMYGGVATKDAGVQAEIAALKARLAEIEGDQPATILPNEVEAALKSEGPAKPQEPDKQQIESTPDRPWAGWASKTFPELYQNGENA